MGLLSDDIRCRHIAGLCCHKSLIYIEISNELLFFIVQDSSQACLVVVHWWKPQILPEVLHEYQSRQLVAIIGIYFELLSNIRVSTSIDFHDSYFGSSKTISPTDPHAIRINTPITPVTGEDQQGML